MLLAGSQRESRPAVVAEKDSWLTMRHEAPVQVSHAERGTTSSPEGTLGARAHKTKGEGCGFGVRAGGGPLSQSLVAFLIAGIARLMPGGCW